MPGSWPFDDPLTAQNLRLLLVGAGCALLVLAVLGRWRTARLPVAGWAAPVVALVATGRFEWPAPGVVRLAVLLAVGGLAGAGLRRLGSGRRPHAAMVSLLVALFGIWLGQPENGPAVLMTGVVLALWGAGPRTLDGAGGTGLTLALAWTVALGAGARDLTFAGGVLALAPLGGLAVGGAMRRIGHARAGGISARLALAAHLALVTAAARWVAVAPDAGWERVALLVGASVALGASTRRRLR